MNLFVLAAIVLAFAAVSVGLMHAVRRSTAEEHLLGQIEHGSGIFAVVGTAFAVVLAFVVLVAFDNFNEARTSFLLLFADRRESFLVQASVMVAVSAMVAGSLLLVWFLDHPYSGHSGSIEPQEMELAAEFIANENTGLPLCTEAGRPRAS